MTPAISVVGKSNSGKTTFLVKLIAELKSRGYRVATIKHSKHDFEIDHQGKDSYRHTEAGADTVVISSPYKFAMIKKLQEEKSLNEIIVSIGNDYDIIITEGWKSGPFPKIEVSRRGCSTELISTESELVALVTDNKFDLDLPHFNMDDAFGVADFIQEKFLEKTGLDLRLG